MRQVIVLGIIVLLIVGGVAFFVSQGDSVLRSGEGRVVVDEKGERTIPIIQDVPKDAIPPLDFPKYESIAQAAQWLRDEDIVLAVEFNNDARAYPVKILNWHEIINESIGGEDVAITYCPLCNSGVVFDRHLGERELIFGNTGALYESAMVMYDRQTESYWYHINGEAIKGELIGQRLTILPSVLTTWKEWKKDHPNTQILSLETGYQRNYLNNPYLGYDDPNSGPAFPVSITDDSLPLKENVVGITVEGISKAYPVKAAQGRVITDTIKGKQIEVVGDITGRSAQIFFIENGERVLAPVTSAFWFAWFAAHTDTLIYVEP